LKAILALVLGGGLVVSAFGGEPTWPDIRRRIDEKYPLVASLTTVDLARWLDDARRRPPILIDVRSRAEFDTSHIAGACWAETRQQITDILQGQPHDQPIVLYCSVGWRSAQIAEHLRRAGRGKVFNLDGSIFQWANEGRPLVREGLPVKEVHPYNAEWGRLLDRRLWADQSNTSVKPAVQESRR